MKTTILSCWLLLAFGFNALGQVDSAAVVRQVDSLLTLSQTFGAKQDFANGLVTIELAQQQALEKLGRRSSAYANTCFNYGKMLHAKREFLAAEKWYLESKTIREYVLGKNHPDYAFSLSNLGALYSDLGQLEKVEALHLEAKAIREKTLGKEHADYINSLNNLAIFYMDISEFEKAEQLYFETLSLKEKVLGKETPSYAATLNNLGILYARTGQFKEALAKSTQTKEIREKTLGKNHAHFAQSLNNIGAIYFEMTRYSDAEPYYLEALELRGKLLGQDHPDYATTLRNLGSLYSELGRYHESDSLLRLSKSIVEKNFGKQHVRYAIALQNLADLHGKMRRFDEAEMELTESKVIREHTTGNNDEGYAKLIKAFGDIYLLSGKFEQAAPLYIECNQILNQQIYNAASYLSEKERYTFTTYFASSFDYLASLEISAKQSIITTHGACYDNALFLKGFLLNAAAQITKWSHTDSLTTNQYNLLKSCRRRLAKEYAKPITERKYIPELEMEVNGLEKDLSRMVAGFGEALRKVTWQEVQSALKPGEAAIEFIRFEYHRPMKTDSVLYAALLLKSGMKNPAFIPLFEAKQLQMFLNPRTKEGSEGLNELYGGASGQMLFQLLWAPLESSLTNVNTIYYSPAGLVHRLNLNAIPTGKPQETLGDRYVLAAVSSTRQLVVPDKSLQSEIPGSATATIFGGIQYDMDSIAIQPQKPDEFANRQRGLAFQQPDSTLHSSNWQYLKWSDKETEKIRGTLERGGISTKVFKGWLATEEAFKQIGKDEPSPSILHVSTHGFFFSDPTTNESTDKSAPPEPGFKSSSNPMIRAGLILAGANYAWTHGQPLGDREDGILTAYEISQLDLRNTDLVVLSACETGLGQIADYEGVYGLQRAFKIAGAKYLVMSLWQVPDYQTQELMTAFYHNLLTQKMSARTALSAAQEEMRQKRYEPFYWAGFVLVE